MTIATVKEIKDPFGFISCTLNARILLSLRTTQTLSDLMAIAPASLPLCRDVYVLGELNSVGDAMSRLCREESEEPASLLALAQSIEETRILLTWKEPMIQIRQHMLLL
jgi:hypothetical protein